MTETERANDPNVSLNDNLIRLIGIPSFGIVIPNVTGLIDGLSWNTPQYWVSYVYFIALSGMIWQGNRYLLFRTRRRFTWFDKPIEKLVLLVFNNLFYTAPVTVAVLCFWYSTIQHGTTDWAVIRVVTLMNVICVLFVTHVYETVFMVKEQQNEQVRNAELAKAKAEAELSALRNQVAPHFMFNSLNTLTYLIRNDSERASLFTENLAEVYRYILVQKESSLVMLEDELEFTQRYTDLLTIRFGHALIVGKTFDGETGKRFLIPPTSVFIALENAVKHNEISEQHPMVVKLDIDRQLLSIQNSVRRKVNHSTSPGIGLKNLEERFRLLTGSGIVVQNNTEHFTVQLPLIPIN
jgi:sensor histidine kinase YesM